jgi:hypothetical protein
MTTEREIKPNVLIIDHYSGHEINVEGVEAEVYMPPGANLRVLIPLTSWVPDRTFLSEVADRLEESAQQLRILMEENSWRRQ